MKTYVFDLDCHYTYKVKANNQKEAEEKLVEGGDESIEGEYHLEETNYQNIQLMEVIENWEEE
tara:strand:+ start:1775 stop:1963 length:189 start_codon:yes stop_codon:yes gene_type:complete